MLCESEVKKYTKESEPVGKNQPHLSAWVLEEAAFGNKVAGSKGPLSDRVAHSIKINVEIPSGQ